MSKHKKAKASYSGHSKRAHLARTLVPKVFVIRHGETDLNAQDKIRGWSDPKLNAKGVAGAQKLGDDLNSLSDKPTMLVSSDLSRAKDTADTIAAKLGLPTPPATEGLRPWNVGDLTGVDSKTAIPIMNDHVNNPSQPLPGGESFNDFKTRFLSTLADLISKMSPQDRLGIVTHNRGERLIDAFLKDRTDPSTIDTPTMLQAGIPPASYQKYEV